MGFKAGQIFKSDLHEATVTILEVTSTDSGSKVSFKIEVPKDKWESCTEWFVDVFEQFLNDHEFMAVA